MTNILEKVIGYIYPKRCPICHDIVADREVKIHKACLEKLPIIKEPRCKKCGKQIDSIDVEYCFDCTKKKHYFDEGYGALLYDEKMQKSMTYFKFYGRREYGAFYGELLMHLCEKIIKRWQPDVLIPIPIHRRRRNSRGYNQAEIIGRVLSKGFSIPIRSDLIRRVKNTKAQKELNIDERKKNLSGAFLAETDIAKYHKVLIVDDIYTTGSTIDEIAKEMKRKGVEKVFFVTVCQGHGF